MYIRGGYELMFRCVLWFTTKNHKRSSSSQCPWVCPTPLSAHDWLVLLSCTLNSTHWTSSFCFYMLLTVGCNLWQKTLIIPGALHSHVCIATSINCRMYACSSVKHRESSNLIYLFNEKQRSMILFARRLHSFNGFIY